MQSKTAYFARCLASLLALASMGYAAPGDNSNQSRRPLLEVTSPQTGATAKGLSLKVNIQVHQAAKRLTFRARLNGKDITARFAGSGACHQERCPESAILTPLDGLIEGRNVLRLRIKKWNGNPVHTRTVFLWTQSNPASGGVGTAVPGIFQPNYTFTTLQPGGYQGNGQPWFQISSNALGTVTKSYPKNPIQCTNSVYLLVQIDRRSLDEIASTCLASAGLNAALSAIPSTSFAVFGSLAGINADWSNLNPSAVGGTDYRKVGDQEAPWGYMMVGIGGAPLGIGLESYNTGYERSEAELAQIHGVLTANAYGLYDLHPSDNAIVNVDGVNKRVQIDGVTYAPPASSANVPSGFWVLPITRRTLSPTAMVEQDNSNCPASCGAVFDLNSPASAAAMTNYIGSVSVRSLIFVIAWGKQPGFQAVLQDPNQQPYTLLSDHGIPVYTFTQMSDPSSAMAAVVSPDPAVTRNLQFNRGVYVSSTPSTVDQHGQLSLVLSRDPHYLQRPVSGVQNNFDPSPGHMTIDLSFLKTVWQPASPWPMLDTPGRVNAYQYLSYRIFHTVWSADQQPSSTGNDIRSIYDEPFIAMDLAGVDPRDPVTYPFPEGGTFTRPDNGVTYTFTRQDQIDVAQQVNAELRALDRVLNLLGNEGVNLRGMYVDNEISLVDILLSELDGSARTANDTRPGLAFRIDDLTNWTASMAGITSLPQMQSGSGYLYGVMSGLFHAMGSSGLLDPRGDGIPDYTVTGTVQSVIDNLDAYTVHADDAYEAVYSNIVQDWSKLNALSQFADPGQQDNFLRQAQSTAVLMQLAARRYFNSMVMVFKWQIDRYINVAAAAPSQVGTWGETSTRKVYCRAGMYNDTPTTAWAVLPSAAQPGQNDVYVVAGEVSDNWSGLLSVAPGPASLLDPLFQTDALTGMPGLPKAVWFTQSPVPFRPISQRPSWNEDYDPTSCNP
jgi:hypothetical protein